jgi:Predicted membrane protein
MYDAMADGIKTLDFGVIIPLAIGGIACVLLLSKVADYIFKRAYAELFHFILGVVFASTIMIIPFGAKYTPQGILISIVLFIAGAALAFLDEPLRR